MRLIDVDALGIGKCNPDVFENKGYADGWNMVIEILQSAPTVDSVVVVRCNDCKYMHTITEPSGKQHFHCQISYGFPEVRETDFCNHGERKRDNE